MMRRADFASMSVEELWAIYEEISELLEAKLLAEKKLLEGRLSSLGPAKTDRLRTRHPYRPVLPKFANPDEPTPSLVWPRKTAAMGYRKLASGLALEDLSIGRRSSVAMPEDQ